MSTLAPAVGHCTRWSKYMAMMWCVWPLLCRVGDQAKFPTPLKCSTWKTKKKWQINQILSWKCGFSKLRTNEHILKLAQSIPHSLSVQGCKFKYQYASREKLSAFEIPLDKELTTNCPVETWTKLEELIPAAMDKYGQNENRGVYGKSFHYCTGAVHCPATYHSGM